VAGKMSGNAVPSFFIHSFKVWRARLVQFDFIPVLGYLDDVILLPAFVALTIKLIPDEVFMECRKESEGLWANGKPKKWYYAIPIVIFWLLIIFVIVKVIWF